MLLTQTYTHKGWMALCPVLLRKDPRHGDCASPLHDGRLDVFWFSVNEGLATLIAVLAFRNILPLWGIKQLSAPITREVDHAD